MTFDARTFLEGLYDTDSVPVAVPDPLPDVPHTAHVTLRGYLVPDNLPEAWREFYEERASIRENEGEQALEHAEAEALRETLEAMRQAGENLHGAP